MKVTRNVLKRLIRESVRRVIREAIIIKPPLNAQGEETLLLAHAAGLIIQHLKGLYEQLPEDLGEVLSHDNKIVAVRKSDPKAPSIFLGLAIASGRAMTVSGKKTLENNKNFFKGQFLKLCQNPEFYFTTEIQDLSVMGDKTITAFTTGTAHGSTYDSIFMSAVFRKMNLIPPEGYFPSFTRPGDSVNYTYINRTSSEIKDEFDFSIRSYILRIFNLKESDLINLDVGFESRVSSDITIEDLEENTLGWGADAFRCKNFFDLLSAVKDEHLHERLAAGNISSVGYLGNPVAESLYKILNDYYSHVKSYSNNEDFIKESEEAGLNIESFKRLLGQKLELVNQYRKY